MSDEAPVPGDTDTGGGMAGVRPLLLVGGALLVGMLALTAWAWPQIPDDARVPIHWGPGGEADRYGSKAFGLLGLPVVTLLLLGLLAVLPRIEPRRSNLGRSATAYNVVGIGAIGLMAVGHGAAVSAALGSDVNTTAVLLVAVGALFLVIGLFLPRVHSTWFFGIRTPWTLTSEESWVRTHRAAGPVFVGCGLITIVTVVVGTPEMAVWVMLAALLSGTAGLVVYSYRVWRADTDRSSRSRGGSV